MVDSFQPGERVAGRYRLDRVLGVGGFGSVYGATDLATGGAVALKVLLPHALAHVDGRARFHREAELSRRIADPHVVRLLDFGETERGLPFIVWELLVGRTLEAEIAAAGPMAVGRAAKIAVEILEALAAAHALGIVHRDVKPANVFLCPLPGGGETVKVLDFGIAKSAEATRTALTRQGSVLGTPAYMAPEQVLADAVTPAADLYALGLVMAEMVAGRAVFAQGSALEVFQARLLAERAPLAPEVLGSVLGPVIAQATERAPTSRPRSAVEMRARILAAIDGATGHAWARSAAAPPPVDPLAATYQATPGVTSAPHRALPSAPTVDALGATQHASSRHPPPSAPLAPVDAAAATVQAAPRSAGAGIPAEATAPTVSTGAVLRAREPARAWRYLLAAAAAVALLALGIGVGTQLVPAGTGPRLAGGVSSTAGTYKGFGKLDTRQMKRRIEAAGYKVVSEADGDQMHTYALAPAKWICFYHFHAELTAEQTQIALASQGLTARDGAAVLFVHGFEPTAAKALLERLARP